MSADKPMKLGEILIQAGIIDKLQLNTALKYQREWDRKLGEALVELGFLSEPVLAKVLSKFLQVPSVELSQVRVSSTALQKIPKRLAEKYGMIPLEVQGEGPRATLIVAMIDPTNLVAIDEVAFTSGCKVKPVVATHSDIEHAIRRYYGDDRVVDVFFESPTPRAGAPTDLSFTPPPEPASEPEVGPSTERNTETDKNEISDMVIMRSGVETRIPMHQPVKVAMPTTEKVLAGMSEMSMLRALLALLIRKKIITIQELQQAAHDASNEGL